MRLMGLSVAKKEYDKLASALQHVRNMATASSSQPGRYHFEQPELIKQGRNFGVRLTASAPSIHMVQANIQTEVTPSLAQKSKEKSW